MGSIIIVLSTGNYLLEPSLPISDFKGASADQQQQQVGYYIDQGNNPILDLGSKKQYLAVEYNRGSIT